MASKRTADKQHRWLSQVEVTGVVFSEPVLAEAAPAGFPNLDKKVLAQFHKAREIWNLPKGMVKEDPQAAWVRFILEEILRHRSTDWLVGAAIPPAYVVNLPAQQETIRPTRVLVDGDTPVLLLIEVPRTQSLDRPWVHASGRWKASPTTKMERLLRESSVELGLVTNGEAWRLVAASPTETASWITWTATTWADSPLTLAAFRDLLGSERFFAGPLEGVPLALIRQSRERQLDVADQLGEQTREALSLFIRALDEEDASRDGQILAGYSDTEVFEAGVAFVMRILFLLFAEENGLLPHGSVAYDRAYGVLHLLTELEHQHRLDPERLTRSHSAYARLLATSRLVYDGSVDPDIRIAAHGGRLFDPGQYPLLEGRGHDGRFLLQPPSPPRIQDTVVRAVLRSLKYAEMGGVRQLVSYRSLAVEQIGHMYEGLLDRAVGRAPQETGLYFLGKKNSAIDSVPTLESDLLELDSSELVSVLTDKTGMSAKAQEAVCGVSVGVVAERPEELRAVLRRLCRPTGYVRPGGRYLTLGKDRKSQGAHYTPLSLTRPIVEKALTPLVHEDHGPHAPLRLKTPRELLGLRVCDPAMGSGAFLVQAVRFLAGRLVEAWDQQVAELDEPGTVLTMPFAEPSDGSSDERLLPDSQEERLFWARRYVAEHCVYGVDLNPHAVEMAKLSLWIGTASADRPFAFLDHALKHGNSIIGLSQDQIGRVTWTGSSHRDTPLFAWASSKAEEAAEARGRLHALSDFDYGGKLRCLNLAEDRSVAARTIGDRILQCFFGSSTATERKLSQSALRNELAMMGDGSDIPPVGESAAVTGDYKPLHWELIFPEVFRRDRPGFDAVIGNPPYDVLSEKETGDERIPALLDYLKLQPDIKRAMTGKPNLYKIFIARFVHLARRGGAVALVVPMAVLGDKQAQGCRKLLFEECRLTDVHAFPEKDNAQLRVFRHAKIATCAIVGIKSLGNDDPPMRVYIHPGRSVDEFVGEPLEVTRGEMVGFDQQNLTIPTCASADWAVAKRVVSVAGFSPLGSYCKQYQGEVNETTAKRHLTTDERKPAILRGANITLYAVREASQGTTLYLDEASFLRGKKSDSKAFHFRQRRVGFQRSSPQNNFRRLIAAPIPVGVFCFDTVSYVTESSTRLPLGAVLAALNSKLFDFYFRLTSTNSKVNEYQFDNLPWRQTVELRIGREVLRGIADDTPDAIHARVSSEVEKHGAAPSWTVELLADLATCAVDAEKKRGSISRRERSSLGASAQRFQDRIDAVIFGMFGLSLEDATYVTTRLSEMR